MFVLSRLLLAILVAGAMAGATVGCRHDAAGGGHEARPPADAPQRGTDTGNRHEAPPRPPSY